MAHHHVHQRALPLHSLLPSTLCPTSPTSSSPPRPTRRILLLCLLGASALLLLAVSSSDLLQQSAHVGLRAKRATAFDAPAIVKEESSHQLALQEVEIGARIDEDRATDRRLESAQPLPTCERTLLYRFAGVHGFASEYLIFLRVALLARRYGYAVFVDDQAWNYGRWEDYFEPIYNDCAAPFDLPDTSRMPIHPSPFDPPLFSDLSARAPSSASSIRAPEWTTSPHVIWSTRRLAYLDDLILSSSSIDPISLSKQHEADLLQFPTKRPLDPSAAVPDVFRGIFSEFREILLGAEEGESKGLWRLNKEMQELVDGTKEWTESLVQTHTDSGKSHKEKKRTVIVAHVRLGDKSLELANYGPQTFPKPSHSTISSSPELLAAWTLHHKSAKAIFSSFSSSQKHVIAETAEGGTPSGPGPISDDAVDAYMTAALGAARNAGVDVSEKLVEREDRPVLLLMSDDASGKGLDKFREHPKAVAFDIITGLQQEDSSTASTKQRSKRQSSIAHHPFTSSFIDSIPDSSSTTRHRSLHRRSATLSSNPSTNSASSSNSNDTTGAGGFTESIFNSLPLSSRVHSTRLFLRDLTVLASLGDGLVFTGSSNVGRLWTLLAGLDQLKVGQEDQLKKDQKDGESEEEGKGQSGCNLWSADVRWFPSVRYQ